MQFVSACLARDLPVYQVTCQSLRNHVPDVEIHVVTRKEDFPKFRNACGSDVTLWDESTLLPDMTLAELRTLPLAFFPTGAGWYFQQFLKYAFVNVSNADDYFMIWDADTVLLNPLEFFDSEGRPYYTKATEHHRPYFETFQTLFGVPADREYSFISQHQIIHKATLRRMLGEIEELHPGHRNWAWAIMANLRGQGSNLFSEYETYGHYLKLKQPEMMAVRELRWIRDGGDVAGYPPRADGITKLAMSYDFAAFEANNSLARTLKRKIMEIFR